MDLFKKLRDMNILLIDDNEWIRRSMGLLFEYEGCHLQTLETAEEGLEALKRQDYELIILDYKLPGIDGLEFVRRIQKTHPDAIKILITAYGSMDVVSEAYKLGVADVIKKPFTIEALEESLRRLIKKRDQNI